MASLGGCLLVATPDLDDGNFSQTVVLVVQHDDEGAFGLVLNRAGTMPLATVWKEIEGGPCPIDMPVQIGGPVAGPLVAVHGDPALAEHEILPGMYFARDGDLLAALVAAGTRPMRVFAGYSGWGPGQLEAELETGSWSVTAATHDFVFGDDGVLWRRVSRHVADERLISWLRVPHAPERPWHN